MKAQDNLRDANPTLEQAGISVRMEAVIRGRPEALQYRPTLMGMG